MFCLRKMAIVDITILHNIVMKGRGVQLSQRRITRWFFISFGGVENFVMNRVIYYIKSNGGKGDTSIILCSGHVQDNVVGR